MATRPATPAAQNTPSYVGPFITVAILFGIFGALTSLNNVLVKKLEDIFQLGHGPAMLATAAWFSAYLIFSVPWAKVIEKVGYKRTMVISLFWMAGGAALFLPAANMVSFKMTLFAIFFLATGVTGLQTSANPYVSILGPEKSAPARLTLAQAFNSIGSFLAPIGAGYFIFSKANQHLDATATAHMLHGPYLAIAMALLVLGVIVMMLHLPAITSATPAAGGAASEQNIWSYPHTVLGMVGIFFYVGIEIALASITIQFCQAQGMNSIETATLMVGAFYFLMMIGRLLGSLIMVWIKAEKLLVILGVLGVALLLAAMFTHGNVAIGCLVATGIANSVMYPNIFALGIAELGPLTSKGSGVITIGNFGGAVLPPFLGWVADSLGRHYAALHDPAGLQFALAHHIEYHSQLADRFGIQWAFIIPIVGYIFVVYYGLSGYKPRKAV